MAGLLGFLTGVGLVAAIVAYSCYVGARQRMAYFVPVVLIALLARLIVFLINQHIMPLPGLESDAVRFENLAVTLSQEWRMADWTLAAWAYAYTNALAIIYYIGGPFPELLLLLNALVVVMALGEIAAVCNVVGLAEPRRTFALLAIALWPLFVLYTSAPLREAPLVLGLAMYVHGILRARPGYEWRSVRAAAGIAMASILHIGFIVLLPATVLFSAVRARSGDRSRRPLGIGLIGSIGVTAIIVVLLAGYLVRLSIPKLSAASLDGQFTMEAVIAAQQAKARGDGAYTLHYGWSPHPLLDLILVGPEAAVRLMLSPFPWELSGSATAVAIKVLDTGLHAALLAAVVYRLRRRPRGNQLVMIGIYVLLALVFGLGTGNDGIAARHRTKFFWIPIVVALSPATAISRRPIIVTTPGRPATVEA